MIAALVDDFRRGRRTPLEVCQDSLERAVSPEATGAFISLRPDEALAEAARSTLRWAEGRPRGPLDGVPVAWKDLFDLAGTVTTGGSATRRDAAPADADAPVVANLKRAGTVSVGKTNLSELAYSGLGLNPHFGTPRNPFDPERVPGGSSAGSAVAVAAGVVPGAIGTDTSGSLRVPASFCGLVGYRPTSWRVAREGVMALAPSLDTVGPLATTVADTMLLDAALRGEALDEPTVSRAADASAVTLVVPEGELTEAVDPVVAAVFDAYLERLAEAGVAIERRPVPVLDAAFATLDLHGTLVGAEAAIEHAELLASEDADLLDPRVRKRLEAGRLDPADYRALLLARPALEGRLTADLGKALLAFPTVRHQAPTLVDLADDDTYFEMNAKTLRSTMVASYLDLPSLSLPCGTDEDGLPVGLHLSALTGRDAALFRDARSIEVTKERIEA
jgi:aspartyl-tRNA(Asn)/glutamyl-tRNA(Gln) amidotransferase subunit A